MKTEWRCSFLSQSYEVVQAKMEFSVNNQGLIIWLDMSFYFDLVLNDLQE